MPYDHARNTGCLKLLELGWEWLFFLDDDVIPPPDAIIKLMSHKKPIVSGLYYRRYEPLAPVMLRDSENGPQWIQEFNAPDLLEVDYVGAGCLLIHRDVIKQLPPLSNRCQWFEWRCDRTDLPHLEKTSEDFTFCKHARNHGFKIYVDTSVQCRHAGLGQREIGGFKPLEIRA
jgi:GT2 family glycosyltransferase